MKTFWILLQISFLSFPFFHQWYVDVRFHPCASGHPFTSNPRTINECWSALMLILEELLEVSLNMCKSMTFCSRKDVLKFLRIGKLMWRHYLNFLKELVTNSKLIMQIFKKVMHKYLNVTKMMCSLRWSLEQDVMQFNGNFNGKCRILFLYVKPNCMLFLENISQQNCIQEKLSCDKI